MFTHFAQFSVQEDCHGWFKNVGDFFLFIIILKQKINKIQNTRWNNHYKIAGFYALFALVNACHFSILLYCRMVH